jgi:hypothetical protein
MTRPPATGARPARVDDELFPFESRFVELGQNRVHGKSWSSR